jgi:hypothetical protein
LRLLDGFGYQRRWQQRRRNAVKTARPSVIIVGQQVLQGLAFFALLAQPFRQALVLNLLDIRQTDAVSDEAIPIEEIIVFFARKILTFCARLEAVFLDAAVVTLTGNRQRKYFAAGTFAGRCRLIPGTQAAIQSAATGKILFFC